MDKLAKNERKRPLKTSIEVKGDCLSAVVSVLVVMAVLMSFTGMWPTEDNPYRSYSLQACAWLEGRLDLGQDYPWLELAVYEGKYYVSFPPFPSFVLLPFCAAMGSNTPDHFIALAVTALGVIYAMRLYGALRGEMRHAEFFVLFLFLGNGYVYIGMQGWVWHLAQSMCFTLSLMALAYAAEGRGGRALACWACAVGCRPMVAVYLPLLLFLLGRSGRREGEGFLGLMRRRWTWWIAPALLAGIYMALNAARFGSVFEFGHSYLPEFTRVETGQFNLGYAAENLKEILRLPEPGGENGALRYYTYDCQAFWLISPLTIVIFASWLHALLHRRARERFTLIALPAMALAHLMILLCHRTLGGWQFGNRYLLDILPYLFCGLLLWMPRDERFARWSVPLFFLGVSVNLIGTAATYNHWI